MWHCGLTKNIVITPVKGNAGAQDVSNKSLDLLSGVFTPYFAFFLWLFFRSRKRNMAEASVVFIQFSGFTNVVTTIFISPWLDMTRSTSACYLILYGNLELQTFYFAWGIKAFFNYQAAVGYLKVLTVLGLTGLIGFFVLIAAYSLYV